MQHQQFHGNYRDTLGVLREFKDPILEKCIRYRVEKSMAAKQN